MPSATYFLPAAAKRRHPRTKGLERFGAPAPLSVQAPALQALLVGLDHLLDHLAAHGAGLAAGQVSVVALLQIDTHLPWCVFTTKTRLILRSIHITVLDVF